MLASGRPDAATVRARLQTLTPRWVPTEADLASLGRTGEPSIPNGAGKRPDDVAPANDREREVPRHSLPDEPRPSWRLDGSAARGLISLTLAAAVGALAVVVWGWPRGDSVATTSADASLAADAENVLVDGTAAASSSPATALLIVDVDGEVRRPGVVELSVGSRVIDAIKAAGGLTRTGDTGALNLAEVLIDGQQVIVPSTKESGPSVSTVPSAPSDGVGAPAPAASGSVSLNSATATELEILPGIGPVLAAAIVEWRSQNGGFTSIDQLQEVSGIGPATFAELAPLVRL